MEEMKKIKKKVKAQSISFFFFFFFFPNIISTIFHENNHVLFKYFFFRLNDKNNFAKIKNNDIHSTKHTSIWSKMEWDLPGANVEVQEPMATLVTGRWKVPVAKLRAQSAFLEFFSTEARSFPPFLATFPNMISRLQLSTLSANSPSVASGVWSFRQQGSSTNEVPWNVLQRREVHRPSRLLFRQMLFVNFHKSLKIYGERWGWGWGKKIPLTWPKVQYIYSTYGITFANAVYLWRPPHPSSSALLLPLPPATLPRCLLLPRIVTLLNALSRKR